MVFTVFTIEFQGISPLEKPTLGNLILLVYISATMYINIYIYVDIYIYILLYIPGRAFALGIALVACLHRFGPFVLIAMAVK